MVFGHILIVLVIISALLVRMAKPAAFFGAMLVPAAQLAAAGFFCDLCLPKLWEKAFLEMHHYTLNLNLHPKPLNPIS